METCESCVKTSGCSYDQVGDACEKRAFTKSDLSLNHKHELWFAANSDSCKCAEFCSPSDKGVCATDESVSEEDCEDCADFCPSRCTVAMSESGEMLCYGGLSWGFLSQLGRSKIAVDDDKVTQAATSLSGLWHSMGAFEIALIPLSPTDYDSSSSNGKVRLWAAITRRTDTSETPAITYYALHVASKEINSYENDLCSSWKQDSDDGLVESSDTAHCRWISTDPFTTYYEAAVDTAGVDCWRVKNLFLVRTALMKLVANSHGKTSVNLEMEDISKLPCGGQRLDGGAKFEGVDEVTNPWIKTRALYPLKTGQLFWQKQLIKLEYSPKLDEPAANYLESLKGLDWKPQTWRNAMKTVLTQLVKKYSTADEDDFDVNAEKQKLREKIFEHAKLAVDHPVAKSASDFASFLLAIMQNPDVEPVECNFVAAIVDKLDEFVKAAKVSSLTLTAVL
eukprot:gnl/Spiro4/14649_TR7891_c0_g1_i1.p1 gnl/Spiro4/14649_TR7891_c0_g1~~gnl/Spiro4/14649_TR7891_c0_g1_i1.p1  ORF type:complete len:451 (+),score=113.66 gnl/Spiro4/14649_TR7891_c0_g1_i1:205-1557(+)